MGQEIVHCSTCGVRLRSQDFEKGEALRVDNTTYCLKCAPAGAVPSQPDPLSTSSTRRKLPGSTARIPIVAPSDPKPSPAVVWGGIAALVVLLGVAAVLATGRSTPPPPPVVAERKEAAPARPKPAPVKPAPQPAPVQAPAPSPTPASAATEAAELVVLDRKTADLSAQERFGEALQALTAARSSHDSLEWTAAIQSRTRDLDGIVKKLYVDLQGKVDQARQRGAEAEVKIHQDRIARWTMPGYGPIAEKPAAAAPTTEPAPPAPVPAEAAAPPPAAPAPAATEKPTLIPFVPGSMKWTLLTPTRMAAGPGAVLAPLEDGSILAGGEHLPNDRYVLHVQTELKNITGFRLEVLPDRSLVESGPGRAGNGNFVLSEFRVLTGTDAGTPLPIETVSADINQEGWSIPFAVDGNNETGWAILPQTGKPHEAVFELKTPLPSGGKLTFHLENQSKCIHHSIGRFRLSATSAKNPASELAARLTIDSVRVDKAIQKGIAWLRNPNFPPDYWMGANELILWTFIHAGVPETDPDFQKRLKQMLDAPLERTYRVALQAMILEELDRVGYQYRIWQCAQFLVDNQCPNGQWHYGTPAELPKGVPTPAKPPVPTMAKLDAEGRRIKPKVTRKLKAQKTRDGPAEGDNSNSQYAALGLRACYDAGVLVPEDTVLRAIKSWRETQHFDEGNGGESAAKGWSYVGPAKDPKPWHAMTAGGVSSLTIYDYILGREWKKTTPTKAGINWIAQSWVVNNNFYYLYGMERAAVLYGLERFGRHAWYPLGAQWILDHQDASGAWMVNEQKKQEDVAAWNTFDTCFAILFLKRATRPLVASEDRK